MSDHDNFSGSFGGGCLGLLVGIFIAAPMVSALFPMPASMEYVLIYFGSILACVVVGAVLSQVIAMARDPGIGVGIQISARRKSAAKKRIQQNAEAVVRSLGSGSGFSDSVLEIEVVNNRTVIVFLSMPGGRGLVYESTFYPEEVSRYNERALLKKTEAGDFEVTSAADFYAKPEYLDISCYIPGDWERHLLTLRAQAWTADQSRIEEAHRQASQLRQEELTSQKKRFGLD